ncbi:MAG TPA: PD-(D/E)XK nuclease family protein [Candidatus Krumholzibacteria bacterium]|nr:PD-(D/E)XK nuclease family protein [Candidatus Krumholzibacteria bacterium]
MTAWRVEPLAAGGGFATALARRLLDDGPERLPATLVLLPSARAGATLAHALADAAAAPALLLPVIHTPGSLLRDLAARFPHLDRPVTPDRLRALALAADLPGVAWLRDHPDAAPGHADALIRLFDDLRLAGVDPGAPHAVIDGADERQAEDADRVAEAWRLYRRRVPHDAVDRTLALIDAAASSPAWPGRPCARLVAAGFVDLKPAQVRLLRAAAAAADEAWILPAVDAPDDALLARLRATWAEPASTTRPDAPAHRVVRLLTGAGAAPSEPEPVRLLGERLAELPAPADPPELLELSDSEAESRELCFRVGMALGRDPRARIGVATNDRGLARRVTARLRDAGVDVDDTSGRPLDGEPEARLVHALLRCALTGPAHEPLLELLTLPLVDFGREPGPLRRRVLRLEQELLRGHVDAADLVGLRARAAEKDAQARGAGAGLTELVDDVARALAPLRDLARRGPAAADVFLDALAESLRRAAPRADLDAPDTGDDRTLAARRLLRDVLTDLRSGAALLPPRPLAEHAADLTRLLRRETVLPRRDAALPVRVTGLLEARLESFDLLLVGGATERHLPGAAPRGLLLGERWRGRVGLADWRDVLGQQAELFARLLGNASRVAVSWPREQDGQPVLPSPLVTRLVMAGVEVHAPDRPRPVLRREMPDLDALDADQLAFLAEPRPAPATSPVRRPASLSHSQLRTWRECPYRWLLERGFGLREEDEVIERLGRKDQGEIVHACLAAFLAPGSEGAALLRSGRLDAAEALLADLAAAEFAARAGRLPERELWEAAFRRGIPLIVQEEAARLADWTPSAVEREFALPLADLAAALPPDRRPELTPDEAAMTIRGRLDRVDADARGDARRISVIDYKTGTPPTRKDVESGEDLQLALYALAVTLGAVTDLDTRGASVETSYVKVAPDEYKAVTAQPPADAAAVILDLALGLLRAETYPLAPGEPDARSPRVCRHCAVADACRREERFSSGEATA